MKVAITGASSFTGFAIAQAIAKQHKVAILLPSSENSYSGLKQQRLRRLKSNPSVEFYYSLPVEEGGTLSWIEEQKPDIWINHHHHMVDYRTDSYDMERSIEVGVKPLASLTQNLKEAGCSLVIQSGSFFEPGEGGRQDRRITNYSKSKKLVWDELLLQAERNDLSLSKVVIPNPIGPLENPDRLIPGLVESSRQEEEFLVGNPESSSDYLPVFELANCYLELIGKPSKVVRPSGLISKTLDWIGLVNTELFENRLKVPPVKLKLNNSGSNISFANPSAENVSVDWSLFWDEYASYIQEKEG